MNTVANRDLRAINWAAIVMVALGFWLSSSLVIDLVIIPSLFASGMMTQSGFASAGYLIFGLFNRIELICAALVLCGFLVFNRNHTLVHLQEKWSIVLASILFMIPLAYTYFLTPQMSSLGLSLDLFDAVTTMPQAMVSLHWGYWFLEGMKFLAGVTLLRWCYQDSCRIG